jgi:ubiquinone biosynthesis protein
MREKNCNISPKKSALKMTRFFKYVFRALQILLAFMALTINIYIINRLRSPSRRKPVGYFIRRTCAYLGATFIKFGQFLAMRIDLFAKDTLDELDKLFVSVAPLPFETIKNSIESAFSTTLSSLYGWFDPDPVASASISQVHRARTVDGEVVAVKVMRPDFSEKLRMDIRILLFFASVADWLHLLGHISLKEAIREFSDFTEKELDFFSEAASADRIRQQPGQSLNIPGIHWDLTRSSVLTMEFMEGSNLVQLAGTDPGAGTDLGAALETFSMGALDQILTMGFFHGDPHPGNIIIQPDNQVALVDFGICGYLTHKERNYITGYMQNVALGNVRVSFQNLSHLFYPTKTSDQQAFKREMCDLLDKWHRASAGHSGGNPGQHLGQYADETMLIAKKYAYRMNMNLLLFWRTLISLDSTVLRFSPDHSILDTLNRFFSMPSGRRLALAWRPDVIPGMRALIAGETKLSEFLCKTVVADIEAPIKKYLIRETDSFVGRSWQAILIVFAGIVFLVLFLITIIR